MSSFDAHSAGNGGWVGIDDFSGKKKMPSELLAAGDFTEKPQGTRRD